MRIVEPKKAPSDQEPQPQTKNSNKRVFVYGLLLALVIGGFVYIWSLDDSTTVVTTPIVANTDSNEPKVMAEEDFPRSGALRIFSGNEFRIFYDNLIQADVETVAVPPVISGNDVADARIRQIAETRGYKLRSTPSKSLPSIQGYQLHESAHQPWIELQSAARAAGYSMSIVSAYRSVDTQRGLFLSRLAAEGVSVTDVEVGAADEQVNSVLITSSIPGYSKHHTGYTIDIQCAGYAFENFKNSPCFDWISANNYEQAKVHGFIPSYPEDADLQGPDPEAWEYVYVGADLLRNE